MTIDRGGAAAQVPAGTLSRFVARLVEEMAHDAASGAVRAAAVDALAVLVSNPLANHPQWSGHGKKEAK